MYVNHIFLISSCMHQYVVFSCFPTVTACMYMAHLIFVPVTVWYYSGTSDICTSYTVSLLQYKYKQLCLKVSVRYIYQKVLHDGLSLSSWVFISVQKWRWTRNSKETLTPFLFNVARMQVLRLKFTSPKLYTSTGKH